MTKISEIGLKIINLRQIYEKKKRIAYDSKLKALYLCIMNSILLKANKKIYFASDFHLGVPTHEASVARERKICAWLESIRHDAQVIFLVGDIFDFWFEYKKVIPKGFIRLQGKLAELSDAGIEIIFFTGNHDMWMQGYFEQEIGVKVFREPLQLSVISEQLPVNSKQLPSSKQDLVSNEPLITDNNCLLFTDNCSLFYIAHGDGLGPGDYGYKLLKILFESRFCRWAFGWLHPNIGLWLAHRWSGSRKTDDNFALSKQFHGKKGEWLFLHAQNVEAIQHHDFYILGHRHLMLDMKVNENARYINLGEWFSGFDDCYYAIFDGKNLNLKRFE